MSAWSRALILLVASAGAWGEEPAQPSYGMLGNTCAGCHGTRGMSAEPMPLLAGQSEGYLRHSMMLFKSGERPATIMDRIARGYSQQELDAMAAFFASQSWMSPQQEVDPKLVRRGQKIHKKRCEACHANSGRASDEKTPRLAGQWRRYLAVAMEEYARPDRHMPNLFMTIVVRRLNDADREALAHFYAAQK